ncbi:MAG: cysteine desulfurase [Clostridiales bacterium]|nr:cysteine desulfurase [Clostridiales bacterium]
MIYLDNAASTRVCKEAADTAYRVMREGFGNTSSTHVMGRGASEILETARGQVAGALGSLTSEIYFTSGGTESDNLAVFGAVGSKSRPGNHIITSLAEHYGVLMPVRELEKRGFEVTYLPPEKDGTIAPEAVARALRGDTALVSVMTVNNETGGINPVGEYAAEIKRRGFSALLHTDAVQSFGKLPQTAKALGADLISVSAHKIHGPKGSGALYIKKGVKITPMLYGGGHESDIRPGTHALPAIAAFGEAAGLASQNIERNLEYVANLRKYAVSLLQNFGVQIISPGAASPYILSISLPGHRAETLMNALDGDGICVARSSACKKGARSHVLEAMGLPRKIIDGALRVSFSHETTREEIAFFSESLEKIAKTLFRRT